MDRGESPINFRFLPAYRKHKHTTVTPSETVGCNAHADILSQDGGHLLPAEVEIVRADDISSSSSSSTLVSMTKPSVNRVLGSNRKRKCIEFGRRVAAFLLSTLGLTVLTVIYAVGGGYMFSALETHNEKTVHTGVRQALQWHIDALWNSTVQLNVLHPV